MGVLYSKPTYSSMYAIPSRQLAVPGYALPWLGNTQTIKVPELNYKITDPTKGVLGTYDLSPTAQSDKDRMGSLWAETLKDSGTKYVAQKPATYTLADRKPVSVDGSGVLGAVAKLSLNALNVYQNKKMINDAAELARVSNIVQVEPVTENVAPVRDMDPEILALRKRDIANQTSQYRGSDPILDAISKSMLESDKATKQEVLGAERAANIRAEENRVMEAENRNAAAAVNARNAMSVQLAQEADRIRDVNVAEKADLRDLYSKALNETVATLDSAATYNTAKQLAERDNLVKNKTQELETLLYQRALENDLAKRGSIDKDITTKQGEISELVDNAYPSYGRMLSNAFRGNKSLVARK